MAEPTEVGYGVVEVAAGVRPQCLEGVKTLLHVSRLRKGREGLRCPRKKKDLVHL